MTNPHRQRNRGSPEHVESMREINKKIKTENRRKVLQGKVETIKNRIAIDRGMHEITKRFSLNKDDRPDGFTFDHTNNRLLDASNREQALEIRKIFGANKDKNLGINSITEDNKGKNPVRDLDLISEQLHSLKGNQVALGGYNGGLNANSIIHGDDNEILSKLNKNQESSLSIDPSGISRLLFPGGKKVTITK